MDESASFLQRLFAIGAEGSFGVREAILLLVVLVVIYMLVMLLRIKSLHAQRRFEEVAAARYELDRAEHDSKKKGKAGTRTEPSLSAPLAAGRKDLVSFYDDTPRLEPKNKYAEPPERAVIDQEKLTRLERDLAATRGELDSLRTAFAQTRDRLQADIERLKTGQRVSPSHGDAMQMALAGASAEEIAARCSIARAEAELVLSLARGSGGQDDTGGAGGLPGEDDAGRIRGPDEGRSGRQRYGSY